MKLKTNHVPFWNRLKKTATGLAALALLGTLTTAQAQITYTPVFTNIWSVGGGFYTNLPADQNNNVRGLGISPITTNVLFSGTSGGTNGSANHVSTIAFDNGSNFIAQLNTTTISTSNNTVTFMNVRVADDGAVYACNRRDGGANFIIYRWPSETDTATAPARVFEAATTQRLGDHMDVRGSGLNTEIVVIGSSVSGANNSTNFFIFRPDTVVTVFTNYSISFPGATATNLAANGVTFEGATNVIWVRDTASNIRRIVYNTNTFTAICNRTNTTDTSSVRGLKYYTDSTGVELLACVQFNATSNTAQLARIYRVPTSPTAALVSVLSSNFPFNTGTNNWWPSRNGNGLANVDAKNGAFAFGAPGYGITYFRVGYLTTAPPSGLGLTISSGTVIQGTPATLTGSASGSLPLTYQFYFTNTTTTNLLQSTTNTLYSMASVQSSNIGSYYMIVTNLYGRATSSVVTLSTVLPNGASKLVQTIWTNNPGGANYYLAGSGDSERGIAYDAVSNKLVVASRAVSNAVFVLNANSGAVEGALDTYFMNNLASPNPGTFAINEVGVADDGAVYACNLLASDPVTPIASAIFAIYRWNSASPTETQTGAYGGNPLAGAGTLGRIGDTMAVRGSGVNTEILCTFRNGTNICVFTTVNGTDFTANVIAITNLVSSIGGTDPFTGASPLGLGVAWGQGNTFWAKSSTPYWLRKLSYDLTSLQGRVDAVYELPGTETALGVDNNSGYLGIIGYGESPQNVAFYDLNAPTGPILSALVDREFYGVNNINGNGTGGVAFDTVNNRVFALSSNNGILAMKYAPRLSIAPYANGAVLSWFGAATLQSAPALTGPWSNVSTSSPYTNTAAAAQFFRVTN